MQPLNFTELLSFSTFINRSMPIISKQCYHIIVLYNIYLLLLVVMVILSKMCLKPEVHRYTVLTVIHHVFSLFKGGFAKCYEIQDINTHQVYAGKIVSKKLMVKSSQRDKMSQEIDIHRSLKHKHVVGFHNFFEDTQNIYIILELCKRRVSTY